MKTTYLQAAAVTMKAYFIACKTSCAQDIARWSAAADLLEAGKFRCAIKVAEGGAK